MSQYTKLTLLPTHTNANDYDTPRSVDRHSDGVSTRSSRCALPNLQGKRAEGARVLPRTSACNFASITALGIALFGGNLAIILDMPDDPAVWIQDIVMSCVTVFFVVEIISLWLAGANYPWSFFFWMDMLGTLSMAFEISFILGSAGAMHTTDSGINPLILRTARASKVGARAARLTRLAKCFAFAYRSKGNDSVDARVPGYNARALKSQLTFRLSTKVAMLTLVLVMGMPLFQIGRYPEEDFSMRAWSHTLDLSYRQAYQQLAHDTSISTSSFFGNSMRAMKAFYAEFTYFPYKVQGYKSEVHIDGGKQGNIPGENFMQGDDPLRKQNILLQWGSICPDVLGNRKECAEEERSAVFFNFKRPNQFGAVLDVFMILFIILCMVIEAFDLNQLVNYLVVMPVERMIGTVRMMARILNAVAPMQDSAAAESDEDNDDVIHIRERSAMLEAKLLQGVFQKVYKVTAAFMQEGIAHQDEIKAMDNESRGVIYEMMMLNDTHANRFSAMMKEESSSGKCVPELPVEADIIESWDLNIMALSTLDQMKVVLFILFDSDIGQITGRSWVQSSVFQHFHEIVRRSYLDNAYHNYMHAVDVLSCLFRVFRQIRCKEWLRDIDMYTLIVSALCHDVAHPGRTTQFLVETRHELAMRYNDNSPLENMHCAKMFEICGREDADAFGKFDKEAYKHARKICVVAIINTDNALHFEMVKKTKNAYETTSDICDLQSTHPNKCTNQYMDEVLVKNTTLWHMLLLHLCDVSTPLKPWEISRSWATRVQDEVFAQGDEEKRLGIPVGMLNDRDKVSRSGSEHGFINFLVAPLICGAVSLLPPLHHLAVQMVENMQAWKELWVTETNPSTEDIAKRDADIEKVKEHVEKLRARRPRATPRNKTAYFLSVSTPSSSP